MMMNQGGRECGEQLPYQNVVRARIAPSRPHDPFACVTEETLLTPTVLRRS